jgi:hypothetical protein
MSDVESAVDERLTGQGGKLRDRADADACFAEVRRRFWIAEARDLLASEDIEDPSEDLLDLIAEQMWEASIAELEGRKDAA